MNSFSFFVFVSVFSVIQQIEQLTALQNKLKKYSFLMLLLLLPK